MPREVIGLHRAQLAFRRSPAIYRGFVGGRGVGKTWIGAYDLCRRALPDRLYMVAAPTYPMMRDSSLRSFDGIARGLGFLRQLTQSAGSAHAILGNGAQVLFRSADNPDRLRGPNLSGAWLDEAGDMCEEAYLIVIGCLREAGEQGWLSATFTPRGRQHWTYRVFGEGRENTELFHARTRENPFVHAAFEDTLRTQYTSAFAEQELCGMFVDLQGTVARREWFRVVDAPPAVVSRVRAWDFAATPDDAQSRGDFTAGALLGRTADGRFAILDMVRAKVSGGQIVGLVRATAEADGRGVAVVIEQEGGSAGKIAAGYVIQELAGWNVRRVKPSEAKLTRAMPMLRQAEVGNVTMVRAEWNHALLDELAAFPGGAHDDQVDAVAHAFNELNTAGVQLSFSVGR